MLRNHVWIYVGLILHFSLDVYGLEGVLPKNANTEGDAFTSGQLSLGEGDLLEDEENIVGGEASQAGDWPWQLCFAQLTVSEVSGDVEAYCVCGAVLIHPSWVITASHCLFDEDGGGNPSADDFLILGGITSLDGTMGEEQTEEEMQIAEIHINPNYDSMSPFSGYDITLLKLAEPVELTEFVQTIGLATAEGVMTGEMCHITGWGTIGENKPQSRILLQAQVPLISHDDCAVVYKQVLEPDVLSDDYICVGDYTAEYLPSSCRGDSGGPLVCQNEGGDWELRGIASWGPETCKDAPSAYLNIAHELDFIKSTMGHDYRHIGQN